MLKKLFLKLPNGQFVNFQKIHFFQGFVTFIKNKTCWHILNAFNQIWRSIQTCFAKKKIILRQFWDIFGPKNRSKSPLRNSLRIGFQTHWSTIFQKMNFFTFSWLLRRLRGREFLKMVPFDFYDHFTSNKCQTNNCKALCNTFFRS